MIKVADKDKSTKMSIDWNDKKVNFDRNYWNYLYIKTGDLSWNCIST